MGANVLKILVENGGEGCGNDAYSFNEVCGFDWSVNIISSRQLRALSMLIISEDIQVTLQNFISVRLRAYLFLIITFHF